MTDIVEWLRDKSGEHNMYRCEEAADRIEQLETALRDIVSWADNLGLYADLGHVLHPVFINARSTLENKNGQ